MFSIHTPPVEVFPEATLVPVEQDISSTRPGRVRYCGTSWSARYFPPVNIAPVKVGESVAVIGRQGIILLVMPVHF